MSSYEPFVVTVKLAAESGELEEHDLKATFRAGKVISRMTGGYSACVQKIIDLDHDTIVHALNVAMGNQGAPKDEIHELVFRTGVAELAAPLVLFIRSLIDGGKDPDRKEKEAAEGEKTGK